MTKVGKGRDREDTKRNGQIWRVEGTGEDGAGGRNHNFGRTLSPTLPSSVLCIKTYAPRE